MVSVIIPVYNVETYLDECVQSVLDQTYRNVEIVLIDDGSTDGSTAICDKFAEKDSRIKVIHQENKGLSEARNVGYRNANGQFLYFLDSDDWIEKETIERLRTLLIQTNSSFAIFNAVCFQDGVSSNTYKRNPYERHGRYDVCSSEKMAKKQFMLDEYKPCIPLCFYKAGFIRNNNLSFMRGIAGEDELFSFYAYCTGERVAYCKDMLYHRRMRPGSIMTSSGKKLWKCDSYYLIYEKMLSEWQEADVKKRKVVSEFIVRIVKSYMRMYNLLDIEDKIREEYKYKKIRSEVKQYRGFGDKSLVFRLYNRNLGIVLSGIRKNIRKIVWMIILK